MWQYIAWTGLLMVGMAVGQPQMSEECKTASVACEEDTDCVHRLAVLQSTCVTNTCQPQCRNAVLNLYQNRLGRTLLRTDASCIPGRYELQLCNLLPSKSPLHCNLAKLACEADMQCNAKWGVFVSECEVDASHAQCSPRCRQRLNDTIATKQGAALSNCTCTHRDDTLCHNLNNVVIRSCLEPPSEETTTSNSITEESSTVTTASAPSSTPHSLMFTGLGVLVVLWSFYLH